MPLNIPDHKHPRIVVVGGGFAGLELIRKLARKNFQIVLIDRNNHNKFQPLFYQVASAALGPGDIAFPFRKLFRRNRNVYFRMTELIAVDPAAKEIVTPNGPLSYDILVLATGASTNYFGMKDIEQNSMAMKELSEALDIRNSVLENFETATKTVDGEYRQSLINIVIVGGGATGVELAGSFGEMKLDIAPKDYHDWGGYKMKIWLIEASDRLLGAMSPATSRDTLALMKKLGVNVILGDAVTGYSQGRVKLRSGTEIPTRNLIWTSGIKAEIPRGLEDCPTGRGGRIVVDDFFRVPCSPDIYAVGDMAMQRSEKFPDGAPQQARYAMVQASHVAKNIRRRFSGREETPYKPVVFPAMAEVSRNHAFAEFGRFRLKGFPGWAAWVFIHILTILGVRNRFSVMWNWFWNYITMDLPNRLIIVPRKGPSES